MRNYILITIIFLLTLSCEKSNDKELNKLEIENKELKSQVLTLKDSLSNFEEEFLHSQILIGIADETVLKVGQKNNVVMLFQTFNKKLPEYEIYKVEGKEKIKIGKDTKTRFNYSFTPKSLNDKNLELLVKMRYKGEIIEIPAKMYFDLKK
ncbi:hypothetical protein [Flavobacterium sp. FPG59]|uniref:hypothetical protein n=1 Tax=Flavobacterium sp. FPG59 TaxID=1929267 RepID=UPI000A396DD7|nr:hypothetical protein [Flavobacterium sp. FPG59]OUD36226.1 hypothetical protein FPG59_07030 [Flavobacterium sp. FPG59]